MKVTDPGVIQNSEKDLIEALKQDLDVDAVRSIILKNLSGADLSTHGGEIVVHDGRIAFRMDFELRMTGSLMFDRQGNHISDEDTPGLVSRARGREAGAEQPSTPLEMDPTPAEDDIPAKETAEPGLSNYDLDPLDPMEDLDDLDGIDTLDAGMDVSDQEPMDDPAREENMVDEDISDILQESRDFWEKKES